MNDRPTSLYRFFDAGGQLLYVGITLHLPNRWTDHAHGKQWWREVARSSVEHFADRTSAAAAELAAIKAEKPLYNIVGNRESLKEIPLSTEGPTRMDRLSDVEGRPFASDSLVGSFFLSTYERGWQGCVVAEPRPGIYLVELFSWAMGESVDQQLVPLEDMAGWSFYDSAKWMVNAYDHGVAARWERQRAEAEGGST